MGITQAELAVALGISGRSMPESSVSKIESGLRHVEVDDLMALAIALEVSPLALLLPDTRRGTDTVSATGVIATRAEHLWKWALGEEPLRDQLSPVEVAAYLDYSAPAWARSDEAKRRISELMSDATTNARQDAALLVSVAPPGMDAAELELWMATHPGWREDALKNLDGIFEAETEIEQHPSHLVWPPTRQ
jgi:transcriptional regulator with XRE-family HTH domain